MRHYSHLVLAHFVYGLVDQDAFLFVRIAKHVLIYLNVSLRERKHAVAFVAHRSADDLLYAAVVVPRVHDVHLPNVLEVYAL